MLWMPSAFTTNNQNELHILCLKNAHYIEDDLIKRENIYSIQQYLLDDNIMQRALWCCAFSFTFWRLSVDSSLCPEWPHEVWLSRDFVMQVTKSDCVGATWLTIRIFWLNRKSVILVYAGEMVWWVGGLYVSILLNCLHKNLSGHALQRKHYRITLQSLCFFENVGINQSSVFLSCRSR